MTEDTRMHPNKVYRGARTSDGTAVVSVNGVPLTHIVRHSPTGLEFGYGGSGPADTALSILCDFFGERPSKLDLDYGIFLAARLYQFFKWDFVATADHLDFEITSAQIADFLTTHVKILQENKDRIREVRAMSAEMEK